MEENKNIYYAAIKNKAKDRIDNMRILDSSLIWSKNEVKKKRLNYFQNLLNTNEMEEETSNGEQELNIKRH